MSWESNVVAWRRFKTGTAFGPALHGALVLDEKLAGLARVDQNASLHELIIPCLYSGSFMLL